MTRARFLFDAICIITVFAFACLHFPPTLNQVLKIPYSKMLNAAVLYPVWTFIILLHRWLQFSEVLNSEVLNLSCVYSFDTGPWTFFFMTVSLIHRISLPSPVKSSHVLSYNMETDEISTEYDLFHVAGRKTGWKSGRPYWWYKGRVKTHRLGLSAFCFVLFCHS